MLMVVGIDNPYWPMAPGTRWVSRERDGKTTYRVVVRVTDRTKRIANGVEARVVTDVVSHKGVPVEVTKDYYAQDDTGNVWYLAEDTAQYEHGKPVSHHGSFEAGRDGAEAGIAMPANPTAGLTYRQEYLKGEAEDKGSVVATGEQASTPLRHFGHVLMTRDANPLEPRALEFKFYAKGVGPVLAIDVSGGSAREELVGYHKG